MAVYKKIPTGFAEATSWAMANGLQPAHMVAMTTMADATAISGLRERAKAQGHIAPSYTALAVKAAAIVMQNNPWANRAILGPPFFRKLYQFSEIDISVAVEKDLPGLPGQPYAATIRRTAHKSLSEITNELRAFATADVKTDSRLRLFMRILRYVPPPFSTWMIQAPYLGPRLWSMHRGCACWVNAPSKAGADLVIATWPWPISFSFGLVKERPWVCDGKVETRLTIPLLMSFDRRIQGGGPASRLFAEFTQIIEQAKLSDVDRLEEKVPAVVDRPQSDARLFG